MTQRLGSFRTVLADRNLRRVELAFLGFNMTESATWIAILVYAFERGGAAEMGAVSAILLVPSAIVAPFAAYAGDRFRRDRVLAIDYVVQGVAMGATAATLYADAPAGFVYAAATVASISITFTRPAQNSLLPALTPGSIGWRSHLAGALVMTTGWELFKLAGGMLLAYYINGATLLYGTIGTVVGLLLFLRLASGLFVFGAEVSAVLLDRRSDEPSPATD